MNFCLLFSLLEDLGAIGKQGLDRESQGVRNNFFCLGQVTMVEFQCSKQRYLVFAEVAEW